MEIAKKIEIPENVEVRISERNVFVKGPKGEIEKDFDDPRFNKIILIEKNDGNIAIKVENSKNFDKRKIKAVAGTIGAHIINMIRGVTIGFIYTMKIFYTHFPISVSIKDNEIAIKNFLGERGVRLAKVYGKTDVKVEKDEVVITGPNIEDIGQTAASIEQACKLSKRDRRIFQDGIYIHGKCLQNGEKI